MGVTESTSCDIRVAVYRLTWSGVENCHRWLSLTTTHLNSLDSVGPSTALSASACLLRGQSVLSCFLGRQSTKAT